MSPWVQKLPSLQGKLLKSFAQPLAGLQASVVQGLPSSQLAALPGTQAPPLQPSPTVHRLASVQVALFAKDEQPVAGVQLSSVHGLPSLHTVGAPLRHALLAQTSPLVHALPSSHVNVLALTVQPLSGSHASVVQGLPSLQPSAVPLTHPPPLQLSATVHALPSVQPTLFAAWTQPLPGLQLSSVQTCPSSQAIPAPGVQTSSTHRSPLVHALLSLHAALLLW